MPIFISHNVTDKETAKLLVTQFANTVVLGLTPGLNQYNQKSACHRFSLRSLLRVLSVYALAVVTSLENEYHHGNPTFHGMTLFLMT
jgi:hypothetical protein